jgi:hypothetical protein
MREKLKLCEIYVKAYDCRFIANSSAVEDKSQGLNLRGLESFQGFRH